MSVSARSVCVSHDPQTKTCLTTVPGSFANWVCGPSPYGMLVNVVYSVNGKDQTLNNYWFRNIFSYGFAGNCGRASIEKFLVGGSSDCQTVSLDVVLELQSSFSDCAGCANYVSTLPGMDFPQSIKTPWQVTYIDMNGNPNVLCNAPVTKSPTRPTPRPTLDPSRPPTFQPTTLQPTWQPSMDPSQRPTSIPTTSPTFTPSQSPTGLPSHQPTMSPSKSPLVSLVTVSQTVNSSYAPLSTGAIGGIATAVTVGLIFVVFAIFWVLIFRSRQTHQADGAEKDKVNQHASTQIPQSASTKPIQPATAPDVKTITIA